MRAAIIISHGLIGILVVALTGGPTWAATATGLILATIAIWNTHS